MCPSHRDSKLFDTPVVIKNDLLKYDTFDSLCNDSSFYRCLYY